MIAVLYFFSPQARYDAHRAVNQIDIGMSGLGTDSISDISNNPDEFYGQNVTVQGELTNPTMSDKLLKTPLYINSEESKVEVEGCNLSQEIYSSISPTVKVKGVMKNYTTCNCEYKYQHGWSTSTEDRIMEKSECINDDSGFHQDSRCEDGSDEIRHYLSCQKVIEKKE